MDVILLERVAKLGQMGETVTVRDGFARNYLLPQGKALRSNNANRARFETERVHLEARNLERRGEAQQIADKLEGKSFIVVRAAGETGQLYGSVAARDVVAILEAEGFTIGRSQVELTTPIKAIGLHDVTLTLHAEVEVKIGLNVARSADEAERQSKGEDLSSADAIYGVDEDDTRAENAYKGENEFGEEYDEDADYDDAGSEEIAADDVAATPEDETTA